MCGVVCGVVCALECTFGARRVFEEHICTHQARLRSERQRRLARTQLRRARAEKTVDRRTHPLSARATSRCVKRRISSLIESRQLARPTRQVSLEQRAQHAGSSVRSGKMSRQSGGDVACQWICARINQHSTQPGTRAPMERTRALSKRGSERERWDELRRVDGSRRPRPTHVC